MQEYRGKTEEARVGVRSKTCKVAPSHISERAGTLSVYRPSILPRTPDPVSPSLNQVEREFVAAISQAMEGSLIRYSKRLELMAMAQRQGIGRFQANLLIAQTQQRTGQAGEILIRDPASDESNDQSHIEAQETSRRDKLFLLAALFIISAIVDMVLVKLFFAG